MRHNKESIRELVIGDNITIGAKRYRIQRIASGGMGMVLLLELEYDATPIAFSLHGMRVAVKSVLPEFLDECHRELFRRELTVWAGFRHPNVVAVNEILDAGPDGWVAAMSCCEGSLRDALRSVTKMSVEQATMILCDVIKGLAYAQNNAGALHLDVKPENTLYTPDLHRILRHPIGDLRRHRFMISDWGIASIKQPDLHALTVKASSRAARARTFNNMGTILYMAPERFIKGYRSSIVSDVFSLGMMYLEMLTGMLPFQTDEDPVEVLLSHQYFSRAVDLLQSAQVPITLHPITLMLLSPEPKERPSSYEDLLAMIWSSHKLANNTFTSESETLDPFDFRDVPIAAEEEFERFTQQPSVKRAYLHSLQEYVGKQAANLRAVGRAAEADNVLENYINLLFEQWENEPDNPYHLASVANAAITLQSLEYGRTLLESAISRAHADLITIDLTNIYWNLGRLYHYLRRDTSDELWCYEMALQSQAPEGCRYPAHLLQKTRAYLFAHNEAAVKGKRKHQRWYKDRLQELAPNVDWENRDEITRFLVLVGDSEKQAGLSTS